MNLDATNGLDQDGLAYPPGYVPVSCPAGVSQRLAADTRMRRVAHKTHALSVRCQVATASHLSRWIGFILPISLN